MTPVELIAAGVLVLILLPIIVVDVRERRIPNWLNAALAVAGIGFRAATAPTVPALLWGLMAPIAVILLFLGLIALMKVLQRPGTLGLGDVKFLAASSIWVGFVGSTVVFVVASLLALLFTLARAPWRKLDFRAAIPFSPFLAVSLAMVFAIGTLLTFEPRPAPAEVAAPLG
jgi:leader peptidase (prepilin peptidase)/N-methyltransferase